MDKVEIMNTFNNKKLVAEATVKFIFDVPSYARINNSFEVLYKKYLLACKQLHTQPVDNGIFRSLYVQYSHKNN
jgi:hypothetical protein